MKFLDTDELEAGLPEILASLKDEGVVRMIVRRPEVDRREVLDAGELDVTEGLVGDNWRTRGSRQTKDGSAHPEMQLNLMNSRVYRPGGAVQGTMGARWRSALRRSGSRQGEPAGGHPAGVGNGQSSR